MVWNFGILGFFEFPLDVSRFQTAHARDDRLSGGPNHLLWIFTHVLSRVFDDENLLGSGIDVSWANDDQ